MKDIICILRFIINSAEDTSITQENLNVYGQIVILDANIFKEEFIIMVEDSVQNDQ